MTTAVAILSLGLGIGANTANFSIVNAILFRSLPFEDAERIVYLDSWNAERGLEDAPITWGDLEEMRNSGAFEQVAGFDTRSVTVTGTERPERIGAASVSPELFPLLGVQPVLGRNFNADEGAEAGFESVVLVSDGLWKRLFGGDPEIVGKSLRLNGRELIVAGVMAPGFRFPEREDLWLPMGTDDSTDRVRRYFVGAGKLAEGVTMDEAVQRLEAITARTAESFPETHLNWNLRVQQFRHGFLDETARRLLVLLLAAVGFVLLLACANVANLLLARATDRSRELALRNALGAGRARLLRQMLTESVLLGIGGGLLGLGVASVWLDVIEGMIPDELAFWMVVGVDGSTLLYTALISVGTGLLFGALPALQGTRADVSETLKDAGRAVAGGARGRLRGALVTGEVALAVVLLASAALMMQSFLRLQVADPGFDEGPLLSFRLNLSGDQFDEPAARAEYFRQVNERLGTIPGVVVAAVTSAIPADDGGPSVTLNATDSGLPADQGVNAMVFTSTDGLFDTLGASLLAGRDFTAAEMADADARLVILGKTLAERLWPAGDAVGRTVRLEQLEWETTVIGVAPDLQYEEFGEATAVSVQQVHLPYASLSWRGMAVLLRASADAAGLIGPMRDELAALDATQAPYDIMTMVDRRAFTTWPQRVFGTSFGMFGGIALVLAFCGVYGVITYSVSQRQREMGVRIALGARPADVLRQVVTDALRLTLAGVGIGLVAALLFARALGGVLYGVSAHDPTIFGAVAVLLPIAAMLAAWVPARRASSVDPTEALRLE